MQEKVKIYKIGGGIIDNPQELEQFLKDFSVIKGNKILVHGGGKGANQVLEKLGILPQMVGGRRITDKPTLEVVVSFYAGTTNKSLVSQLQKFSCNALGLSGCDANVLRAKKREVGAIDYGYVGDLSPDSVDENFIRLLLSNKIVPVFCAITHDGKGNLLNTNADTVAATLAQALVPFYEVELHYCFDKIGVLKDLTDEHSLIPEITTESYKELLEEGVIHDGMIPKLENALSVIHAGVEKVILEHSKNISNDLQTTISR